MVDRFKAGDSIQDIGTAHRMRPSYVRRMLKDVLPADYPTAEDMLRAKLLEVVGTEETVDAVMAAFRSY